MTRTEINNAEKLLSGHAERTETAIIDGGGQCLTAHWKGGGQRLFYSYDDVQEWAREHDVRMCIIEARKDGGNWDSDYVANEAYTIDQAWKYIAEMQADPEWAGWDFRLLAEDGKGNYSEPLYS